MADHRPRPTSVKFIYIDAGAVTSINKPDLMLQLQEQEVMRYPTINDLWKGSIYIPLIVIRSHPKQCDRCERSGCPGTKTKRLLLPKGSHFCSRGSQGITIKIHHLRTHFEHSGIYTDTDRQRHTHTHTHTHTRTHTHTPWAHLHLPCFLSLF